MDHRRPALLLAVATGLSLLPVLWLAHFPYQDVPNHIARFVLMDRAWFGTPVSWGHVELVPTPYVAIDLIGVGLVHTVGPPAAARILAAVAIAALPWALYALLGVVAPGQRIWALVAALLSTSLFLLQGMMHYQLGVAAALAWIAVWWPRREHPTPLGAILLTLGVMLLILIHLSAGCIALVLIGLDAVLVILRVLRSQAERADWLQHAPRLGVSALCLVAGAALLWVMGVFDPAAGGGVAGGIGRGWLGKGRALSAPFFTFTRWELAATGVGYAVALGTFIRMHRRGGTLNLLGLLTAVLAGLYLITPARIGPNGYLDLRWLIPAYLLVFCTVSGSSMSPPRWIGPVLLATVAMHTTILVRVGRSVDRDLDAYDAVLDRLPPAARVLPILGGAGQYSRIEPYLHYALWHTARTGSHVGGIFAYVMHPVALPELISMQFRQFREVEVSYAFANRWRKFGSPQLDWPEVQHQYDYIVRAGEDAELDAMLMTGSCPVDSARSVVVYSVGGCR